MNDETKAHQEPRFTRALNRGMAVLRPIFENRSIQYGDTMEQCRWLTMKSVALRLGIDLKTDEARVLFLAGQDDVKYWRQLGGFKADSLLDRLAYCSALIGELDNVGVMQGQHEPGTQAEDHAPHDRACGPELRTLAPLRRAGPEGGLQRAVRHGESPGAMCPPCPPAVGP